MPTRQGARAQHRRHVEAAEWLLRNRDASSSASDRAAFQLWLDEDPGNRRAYELAELLMGDARAAIESDPELRSFKVKPRSVAKPVAGCLLALALAGGLFVALDGPMRLQADVISGAGERPVIALADGSTMQLNASSAVAYDYDGAQRTVRLLRGQAFFQVARDPARPFGVEVGNARVVALGTAFDVRLGEAETDVTVTQHAVLVEFAESGRPAVRVAEGQQGILNRGTGTSEVKPSDPTLALAWRRGQLVVDGAPLSFVVEEMSRHFSGRIVIAGEELAQRRVSGTLAITDTTATLSFIQRALGVSTFRIGPLIVIRG
ncbi:MULTISPECIES: FecR family protein [unclassified Xanthobacter]|uniref:FecR family protein n=1 Tax=unclassified Xanthobacter TaxID=2623496 RepID=UPI001EE09962|nr:MULTISPECIES: FecR family protein [unclassified Xanthobacter]